MTSTIAVVPLAGNHERKRFDCSNEPLNLWLASQATQSERKGLARTFVAVPYGDEGLRALDLPWANPNTILGYYALSSGQINQGAAGEIFPKRIPKNVPIVRLSRLAVDQRLQGSGLGEFLVSNALHRIWQSSQLIGVAAVIVDAKNDRASDFYEKRCGFTRTSQPHMLYQQLHQVFERLDAAGHLKRSGPAL